MRLAALAAVGGLAVLGDGTGVVPAGTMTAPRAAHTATALADGRVLVVGGMGGGETSAELYDPRRNRFTRTGPPLTSRVGHAAVRLRDGRVLVVGGWTREGGRALASAELYDPVRGRFVPTGSLTVTRGGFTATLLRDGRVLVAGGVSGGTTLRTTELYDPRSGRFRPGGRMAGARAAHTAVRLPGGSVLVAGGSTHGNRVLASAELFDPRTARFRRAGPMGTARHKHAAVLLRDGRVLVVGGSSGRDWDGRFASTELYQPRSRRFAPGPRMSTRRFKLADAVVRLADGRVVVAGGAESVEVFSPGTRRFLVEPGRLPAALSFSTASLLPGGAVLVVGGYDDGIRPTARAWMIDPAENFVLTGKPARAQTRSPKG